MKTPSIPGLARPLTLLVAATMMACGKKDAAAPATTSPTATAPAPTGKVIAVEMIADAQGSRFVPSEIEAHPGDVIRFTLTVGVHNIHFLADSNPGVANLPDPSDMLQLPGQTWDYTVSLPAGKTYYFQCDPHLALGMKGHLKVD